MPQLFSTYIPWVQFQEVLAALWLIWFINQRALYNHELSIIIISVVVIGIGIICAHLNLAQG